MRTGNKIAWIYTFLMMGLVIVIGSLFYVLTAYAVDRIYDSYLEEKAYASAEKHWEKDELDAESYALVKKRYEHSLPATREIIFNADSLEKAQEILSRYLTPKQIRQLYQGEDVVHFDASDDQLGIALYYPDNEGNFIVLVLSNNRYGARILLYMRWILGVSLLLTFLLVYAIGKLYASRLVNKIDEAYQREKAFISNASHELNNPLTAIQGECEITLLKERTPTDYQQSLQRIAFETSRMVTLMKHLLFLSKGDQEILKRTMEPIRLDAFLKEQATGQVTYLSNNSDFSIEANPYLLGIAIRNLFDNACKYSSGKIVYVWLEERTIIIQDQGIGIPESDKKRIFLPFYRGGNARGFSGQGIGLTLSVRILRSYGAAVRIDSEVGKGTRVLITF